MSRQVRSKVAPRRSWRSVTGLLLHSRTLHSTLAMMEHQDNVARLISEMPRAHSPRRRTIEIQHMPHAAPVIKLLAKPLVFRKTKRELEREQQQAQERRQLERMQNKKRQMGQTRENIKRARPKCARMLQWSCRRASEYINSRPAELRTQSRRRLF
ncbi:hypothetical protein F441_10516 [Phytophthora nicotianae CJ01A1]|uniref:Uncharacterized protein n=6 Tax=Phytophthora nicotianae TaxID=4792 RepID=W2R9J6_PHYN3|nr:hypothetical protein PPTG_01971 [Phytophthora nicotianae INRA-310]ETI44749.1 hypothetical protein F443_10574 [Phytophthora nicotianae P1569]ETK84736.1 hypothetical protein L915_10333 [Phytophthora nicotianae]ETO73378.1 hypothetical protein F444_10674 [Phytophthora nicotianae P1976]ETP14559.1 hypothetical protein F441_10516 [Phytophthora nicotianae CJ01A1]ETP42641.1 hypothetical protein F442_10469 [Phytophthora nicotianae P10297]